jgi:hypothetical protein
MWVFSKICHYCRVFVKTPSLTKQIEHDIKIKCPNCKKQIVIEKTDKAKWLNTSN